MKLSKRNILFLIKEACDLAGAPPEEEEVVAAEFDPETGEEVMDLASLIMPGDVAAEPEMPLVDPAMDLGGPPVPEDYDSVTQLLSSNAWVVNLAIEQVMEMSGAKCQKSTVMAIIDFLKGMLGVDYQMGEPVAEPLEPLQMAPILYPSM
tara:strand:+ start:3840 stop:4289 length:450 start_codon:yes stop_codon:yes gene_type:complete